jgi:serine/threonine protein kinase
MPLSPGQILNNRYRIINLLGQGGFGAVYRAWDINLEIARAVKENLDTSPASQRQFKREAQILDRLTHPNLPKVIDHFYIPGQGQYLVMEFVDGDDLGSMLRKAGGPLPEALVLEWAQQVCDALIYLHSQNPQIIHRDIKPANIRISSASKAILVDFGIAKVHNPVSSTTRGARAITEGYSPFEQYGRGSTDVRSDLYSLGATLYHLLTGQIPVESVQRVVRDPLQPVDRINPKISARTALILHHALQVDPDRRFQSAAEFKAELLIAINELRHLQITGPTPSTRNRISGKKPPVKNLKWSVIASVLLMAAGFVVISSKLAGMINQSVTPLPPVGASEEYLLELTHSPVPTVGTTQTSFPTFTPDPHMPPPNALLGDTWTSPIDGAVLVYISAGDFLMGSAEGSLGAESNEQPQHWVYLSGYWIDQVEVTNGLYRLCEQAGECEPPSRTDSSYRESYYGNPEFTNFPVIYVSWIDAVNYCTWAGRRLPTEAEWEKAARGGIEGALYPWGNDEPDCSRGNFIVDNQNCVSHTTEVGIYAPNGYGLFDMAGNVWEWVHDFHAKDYYLNSPPDNPQGPDNGKSHVHRGGSWGPPWPEIRVAYRAYVRTEDHFGFLGFRCAITP